MRIWSLHPKYLDSKRLVAQWREGLLAKKVLEGKTRGYKSHPQVKRFNSIKNPVDLINEYLKYIYREALIRGFEFNIDKIDWGKRYRKIISVSKGQLRYEYLHLQRKILKEYTLNNVPVPGTHPLFTAVEGGIEEWEKVK